MSEQGWVTAVLQRTLGSKLYTDAAVGATSLVVEYAGDFDDDGILDLNGARLAYTGIVSGVLEDDPDTITLAAPLAVAASEGDEVSITVAGKVPVVVVARVNLGDGPDPEIEVPFEQRAYWPLGDYDPPEPVEVSDDLMRIETVPYREAIVRGGSVGIRFRNTDTFTATAGVDLVDDLTFLPIDGSEHVTSGGCPQLPGVDWTRAGKTFTMPDNGFVDDELVHVSYAYDITDQPPPPPPAAPTITSPAEGSTTTDSTPTISGTGAPGETVTVAMDDLSVGSAVVASDGTWSVTVGSTLTDGSHTVTATQADGQAAAVTFTVTAPVPFTPVVRGKTEVSGSRSTVAMPPAVVSGDFFVLTLVGVGSGAFAASADPRIVGGGPLNPNDSSMSSAVYWGRADGSGAAVSVSLGGVVGCSAALVVYSGGGIGVGAAGVGPGTGAAPAVSGYSAVIAALTAAPSGGFIADSNGVYTQDAGVGSNVQAKVFHHAGDAGAGSFTNMGAPSVGILIGVNGI